MKQVNDTKYLTQCLPGTERAVSSFSLHSWSTKRHTLVHFPAPITWLLGCRGTRGASLTHAVFSQPQSSWGCAHALPPSIQASWIPWPHPVLCSGDLCGLQRLLFGFNTNDVPSGYVHRWGETKGGAGGVHPFLKRGHPSLCLALIELPPCTATSSCWGKNAKPSSSS